MNKKFIAGLLLLKVHILGVQLLVRYNLNSQATHILLREQKYIQFIISQCNKCLIVIWTKC